MKDMPICTLRDISRAILSFEDGFRQRHGLCLNEGMLLCTLSQQQCSCKELAEALGLSLSNTSKVIKSVESKGLIRRELGDTDKRQMFFALSDAGKTHLDVIKNEEAGIKIVFNEINKILNY